jgi:hypothetical protein
LKRGRRATTEKRFEAAVLAFDDAVRARPVDARVRSERGYAYLKWGKADRALTDFVDAQALTVDASLKSQIWFNIALAFESRGDAERERIALAVAAKHGSSAAKKKLGDRSACPALWQPLTAGAEAPIADGWSALADVRQTTNCDIPEPPKGASEAAQAKHKACFTCLFQGEGEAEDHCKGSSPWVIPSGYMHFHHHTFTVIPLGNNQFWYGNSVDMGTPPSVRKAAGYAITDDLVESVNIFPKSGSDLVSGNFYRGEDAFVTAFDAWSDEIDITGSPVRKGATVCKPYLRFERELGTITGAQMGGTPVMPAMGREGTTLYSFASKRAVFTLVKYAGDISISAEPGRVKIKGEGCDTSVEISK